MATNINDLKFSNFGYVVKKFIITVKNDKGKLIQKEELKTLQVKSFFIEKDFDNDYTPIFMVNLAIDEKLYRNVILNQDNTTFDILIQTGVLSEEGTSISKLSNYLSGTFVSMNPDDTPFVNEKDFDKSSAEYDGGLSMQTMGMSYTFILGKKSVIKKTRHIVNKVLTSTDMLNTVSYLFTKAGVSNVLMSPLDNSSSYSEIILLPIPLTSQLSYLNSVFGFYREGAQIFFDFDYTYLLRNCHKCTAYTSLTEIKTVVFCVYNTSSGKNMVQGTVNISGEKTAYIGCGVDSFDISSEIKSSESYMASNTMVINQDGNITNSINKSGGSYNVINSTTHNRYFTNEVKLRTKELEGVARITCYNIDLRTLTPNRQYLIRSNVTKVAKKTNQLFRMSACSSTFVKEGNIFKAVSNIVLKQTI